MVSRFEMEGGFWSRLTAVGAAGFLGMLPDPIFMFCILFWSWFMGGPPGKPL
ncbi:hypothetical protein BC830DRAFT_1132455 [Chytriomyces sp. MP71]|nr:hypothetical protein BC830DRAFT_1132455 [Chytriomyces sp. MP71]